MICPIMSIQANNTGFTECEEENCRWWKITGIEKGECAIVRIAEKSKC